MLREDYIRCAASVHICGTRFLRDTAASLLGCYTLDSAHDAFEVAKLVAVCETLMDNVIKLLPGLSEKSGVTKYTAVAEARMRMLGVHLSLVLTQKQTTAERVKEVPPGTRGDVYNGFMALAKSAVSVSADCAAAVEKLMADVREGKTVCAVPCGALVFLKRLCSDYGAVCERLCEEEYAQLLKRGDEMEKFKQSLIQTMLAQGVNVPDTSSAALASLASSGLVPNIPPILFDLLLRYECLSPSANTPE